MSVEEFKIGAFLVVFALVVIALKMAGFPGKTLED